MSLNLIKLSVGTEDVDQLRHFQARRKKELGRVQHVTRMMPRRREELLAGGSIYWVIRGHVLARQRLLDIEAVTGRDGTPRTAFVLDPELVRTVPRAHRPFQGWRYLKDEDAPADLTEAGEGAEDMPPEMLAELKDLGLI